MEILDLDSAIHVISDFRKEREKWPQNILERPNSENMNNEGMPTAPGIRWKVLFFYIKNAKTKLFSSYRLEIVCVYVFIVKRSFKCFWVFSRMQKCPEK